MTASQQQQSPNSDTVTNGVRIRAAAQYLPEQSDPDAGKHLYVYRIDMGNEGPGTVQLLSRHWIIVDADGNTDEVVGDKVVGEQPILEPGGEFDYRSSCLLATPWGTMEGTYTFRHVGGPEDGRRFEVVIGRFFLVPSAPPIPMSRAAH